MDTYRAYLDPALRDDYDGWRTTFENPFHPGSDEWRGFIEGVQVFTEK